jgi:diguanylate cyclase (GGDEF)-like protein/PAS domain S-box-containing protein
VARLESQQIDHQTTGELFRRLVDHAPDAICVVTGERLRYVNSAALRWLGADSSDRLVGRHIADFIDPAAMVQMRSSIAALGDIGEPANAFEARLQCLDGTTRGVEGVVALTVWEREPAYHLTFHDLRASMTAHRFERVMASLDRGVIVVRSDGYITFINAAAMHIYGLRPDSSKKEFVRRAAASQVCDVDGDPVPPESRPGSRVRGAVEVSKQIYGVDMTDGRRIWLLTSALLLEPDMPAESDMLVSFSDITSEREDLDRLIYRANHDPLTGLPNRAFVLRRITGALASSDRGRLRAVLFIDLDDLKSTNDTLGHQAGDDLLNAAAARLRQAVGPHDVVGRHGGDEFVLMIYRDTGREDLEALVSRLRARLAQPVDIAGTDVPIRASIGIVEVDGAEARTAEEILRDADRAMYKAKRAGRGYRKV